MKLEGGREGYIFRVWGFSSGGLQSSQNTDEPRRKLLGGTERTALCQRQFAARSRELARMILRATVIRFERDLLHCEDRSTENSMV